MLFPLITVSVTGVLVFLSVLFLPYIKLFGREVGTYWLVSLVGAAVLLCSGTVPVSYIFTEMTRASAVNPLKILLLFFSMTALSVFLDEVGFFRYLANLALRKTGNSQRRLFVILYGVVSLLTVFTSNDIVVLTFTPFICFFAKEADIDPLPYLFAEFVASNTWSMLLLIGNPTNIYLAGAAGIDFLSYTRVMLLPTVLGGAFSFALLYLLFRRSLRRPMTASQGRVYIEDKGAVALGVGHLGACTLLLALSSYLSFEMHGIALGFTASLFLLAALYLWARRAPLSSLGATLRRLPYPLIPFVLSMFVLVMGLQYIGVSEWLGALLYQVDPVYSVGISSFLVSNVINNIPMSVLYSSVLSTVEADPSGVYAAVIGSNIGAFFTQVGALAGIMWASILRRFRVPFSFRKFFLYGVLLSVPTLLVSLFGLSCIF